MLLLVDCWDFQAPVSGSKKPAIDGQLIFLAAGDKTLFDACETAFSIMGKRSFYLGAAGSGARMKLVVNMIMGSMMGQCRISLSVSDAPFHPIGCLVSSDGGCSHVCSHVMVASEDRGSLCGNF